MPISGDVAVLRRLCRGASWRALGMWLLRRGVWWPEGRAFGGRGDGGAVALVENAERQVGANGGDMGSDWAGAASSGWATGCCRPALAGAEGR